MELLTESEEQDVIKLLQKRSKFVWSLSKCRHAIGMLNKIRLGEIKLEDFLPEIKLTYKDIIEEQDLLIFCK